jgi:hypothetical protein
MKKVKLTESQLVELIEYSVKKMSVKESINEKYKTWDIDFDGRKIRKNFRNEMDENSVKMWCERYFEKTPKMVSGVSENINEDIDLMWSKLPLEKDKTVNEYFQDISKIVKNTDDIVVKKQGLDLLKKLDSMGDTELIKSKEFEKFVDDNKTILNEDYNNNLSIDDLTPFKFKKLLKDENILNKIKEKLKGNKIEINFLEFRNYEPIPLIKIFLDDYVYFIEVWEKYFQLEILKLTNKGNDKISSWDDLKKREFKDINKFRKFGDLFSYLKNTKFLKENEILEPEVLPDIETEPIQPKRIDPRKKPFEKPEHIEPDSEPTPAKALIENKIKLSKSELERQGIKYNPDCKYYKKGDFIYKVRNDGNYTCYKGGKVHNLGKNFNKEVVDESLKGLALGGAMLANTLTSGTENPNVLKGDNIEMYSQNFKPLNKNMNIKGEPELSLISKPLKTISDGIEFNNNNAKKKGFDKYNIKNINHSFIEKDDSFIIKSEYYIDDTVEYGIGVNESNSKHSLEADLKIYQSELNMLNKIKSTGEKHLKRKEELEKKISDLSKQLNENYTNYSIIGKKVGEIFKDIPGINMISDKVITYVKVFEKEDDFSAYTKSSDFLTNEGYDKGSMYMNYPIPFMEKGKTGISNSGDTMIITKHGEQRPLVITKYDRLNSDNWNEMDGALLSKNFRYDDVFIVFFNFPQ